MTSVRVKDPSPVMSSASFIAGKATPCLPLNLLRAVTEANCLRLFQLVMVSIVVVISFFYNRRVHTSFQQQHTPYAGDTYIDR